MTEADALLEWLQKLSSLGFGTLIALLLVGNFMGIWVWGKFHRERMAWYDSQLAKKEAEAEQWKNMALGLLDPLEKLQQGVRGGRRGG